MHKVSISTTIDAGADAVWRVISEFGTARFLPFEIVTASGHGPGATRRIRTPDGVHMLDRLDAVDHAGRTIRYSLVAAESDPVPMASYQATMRLKSSDDGTTELQWSGRLDLVPGADEKQIIPMILNVYLLGIDRIRTALAGEAGSRSTT
jgi:mxaD protein